MKKGSELIKHLMKGIDEVSKVIDSVEKNCIAEGYLKRLFASEYVSLLLLDKETNTLYSEKCTQSIRIPMLHASGLIGNSFLAKQADFYNHIRSEKLFHPEVDNPYDSKLKSQIIYPLVTDETPVAMLRMSRSIKVSQNYTNNDLSLLKSIEPYLLKLVAILRNETEEKMVIDKEAIVEKLDEAKMRTNNNRSNEDTIHFLANTVHDIRTPANSLYGFLDLIEERIKDPRLLEFIVNAKESAAFINQLTDTILERVKHENEAQMAEETTITTVNFLAATAEIFTGNMTGKNINYLIDLDPSLPKAIHLDAMKLKRVLINLIGNAYKFTPSQGSIVFKAKYDKANKRLMFSIKDTGLGIPKERQKEIFKAFQQASEDTSTQFGGTGLGLTISAKYVEELGGTLNLESEVDVGSIFYFELPVNMIDATPAYIPLLDEKHIVIYCDDALHPDVALIKSYLKRFALPDNKILVLNEIPKNTTHLICFEKMLTDDVVTLCNSQDIKMLVLEKSLLSLSEYPRFEHLNVMTQNAYYGDMLYSMASCRRKAKILIIDDNKINIKLLESILDGEYCDLYHELEGLKGLKRLQDALAEQNPYDIVFLDKHMPDMMGTELLQRYRESEKNSLSSKSTYAVSITGDMRVEERERELYDSFVHKPFKNSEIREICKFLYNS